MDGMMYEGSLALLALFSFFLYRTNNTVLMFFLMMVAAYIVYSHETGNTATDWKNSAVESFDESVSSDSHKYDIK